MALVTLVTVSGLRMAVQNLYNQGMMISEQIVSCVDAAGALDMDYTKMQSYTSNVIHEPSEQTIGGYSDALDQAYGRMVKNIEVFKKYANASKEKETVLDLHEKLKGMYDYQRRRCRMLFMAQRSRKKYWRQRVDTIRVFYLIFRRCV